MLCSYGIELERETQRHPASELHKLQYYIVLHVTLCFSIHYVNILLHTYVALSSFLLKASHIVSNTTLGSKRQWF